MMIENKYSTAVTAQGVKVDRYLWLVSEGLDLITATMERWRAKWDTVPDDLKQDVKRHWRPNRDYADTIAYFDIPTPTEDFIEAMILYDYIHRTEERLFRTISAAPQAHID